MNSVQKEIINGLKEVSNDLSYSPGRREIPKIANLCYKHFGSFNKAKELAGLSIIKRKCDILPKRVYKKDKDLVKLISFLTFDGHLYKDLKGAIFFSKDVSILKEIELVINKKFSINGYYKERIGGYGECYGYWIFNVNLCKFLNFIGAPKGDKMVTKFDVPNWIKKDRKLSREYLKNAFLFEGCKYRYKNKEIIQINLNKSEELIEDGIRFMNSIRKMLNKFGIQTTNIYTCISNKRKKDGKITKMMRFRIKAESNNQFIKEIGWYK